MWANVSGDAWLWTATWPAFPSLRRMVASPGQRADGPGELEPIVGSDQQAVDFVVHHLGDRPDIGGHHRYPHRHGFQNDGGKPFRSGSRGQGEQVSGHHELGRTGRCLETVHRLGGQSSGHGVPTQLLGVGLVSGLNRTPDPQLEFTVAGLPPAGGYRVDERLVALLRIEVAHAGHQYVTVGDGHGPSGPAADGFPLGRRGGDRRHRRNEGNQAGAAEAGPGVLVGHRPTGGHDQVGQHQDHRHHQPTEGRRRPGVDELPDHSPPGQSTGQRPVHVEQSVDFDHIDRFLFDQSAEAEDLARVPGDQGAQTLLAAGGAGPEQGELDDRHTGSPEPVRRHRRARRAGPR